MAYAIFAKIILAAETNHLWGRGRRHADLTQGGRSRGARPTWLGGASFPFQRGQRR